MMMHASMEKAHAAVDEEEQLVILAYLLQLQATKMNNVVPSGGGSKFRRR
jgi:hypothetical protein